MSDELPRVATIHRLGEVLVAAGRPRYPYVRVGASKIHRAERVFVRFEGRGAPGIYVSVCHYQLDVGLPGFAGLTEAELPSGLDHYCGACFGRSCRTFELPSPVQPRRAHRVSVA